MLNCLKQGESRHSRESGIAKTGVEANIGLADGPAGELHDAVHNPVKEQNFFYWPPAFARVTNAHIVPLLAIETVNVLVAMEIK